MYIKKIIYIRSIEQEQQCRLIPTEILNHQILITETEIELHIDIGNSLTAQLLIFDKSWSIFGVQLFL